MSVFLLSLMTLAVTSGQQHLDTRTIMDYIIDEKLNTLVNFVRGTGLDTVLSDRGGKVVTLFAPTEAAWAKLPLDIMTNLASNSSELKATLLDHVVDQTVLSLYVRDKDTKISLNGGKLEFRVYANGARTINGAFLIGTDISLANGLVHKIDDVILNPNINIGEYVASHDSDFQDLFAMLVLGRLFAPLETGGPYTVFAPNDDAFELIRNDLPSLISDRSRLSDILSSHVVADTYWSVGLTDGMVLTTINGDNLVISIKDNNVRVNGTALVLQADVKTNNGVIHVIDKVIT